MKLLTLQLENFRNYGSHSHEFDPDKTCTVIIGNNGQGKTNFLEAIYTLSLGKSFRTTHPSHLITWEHDHFKLTGTFQNNDEKETLEVFHSERPAKKRNFKKNGVNLKNSEYIGNLLVVLFHPEDLNILYLSPSLRRRYLNILLSQTSKSYLFSLSKYQRILKQRNALLQQIQKLRFNGKNSDIYLENLKSWNTQLTEFAAEIIHQRLSLIEFLKARLTKTYDAISGHDEQLTLKYKSQITSDPTKSKEEIAQIYLEKLTFTKDHDIRKGRTTIGPHLDDLAFYINNKEIGESASRGEFRTLLLAIKIAEIDYIQEKTSKNPILLLDDVFSELDPERQKFLLKAIKNCQTIITTTEIADLELLDKQNLSIVKA